MAALKYWAAAGQVESGSDLYLGGVVQLWDEVWGLGVSFDDIQKNIQKAMDCYARREKRLPWPISFEEAKDRVRLLPASKRDPLNLFPVYVNISRV